MVDLLGAIRLSFLTVFFPDPIDGILDGIFGTDFLFIVKTVAYNIIGGEGGILKIRQHHPITSSTYATRRSRAV